MSEAIPKIKLQFFPNRILVLFAHPAIQKSRVNKRLAQVARNLDGVMFHDLYEAYPDFHIDVENEQYILREHDIIVLQHPFYWYSGPAILKEWQDLVLEFGFAYGPEGTALRGKKMINIISTGGSKDAYSEEGHNRYTVREFLRPFEQTASLCGMIYLPPFIVYDAININVNLELHQYVELYRTVLEALRDDKIDMSKLSDLEYINDYFVSAD